MNLTMQQPLSYPFYMGTPQLPYPYMWPSNSYHYPPTPLPYPLPFILSHPPRVNIPSKPLQTSSPYTNTRYNHLKQSTSHVNRHRSIDTSIYSSRQSIPNHHQQQQHHHQYRPLKTKSVSDFQQLSQQNSSHLLKAHSWHSMQHLHQANVNVNYSHSVPLAQNNNNNNNNNNNRHHQHHHHQSSQQKSNSFYQRNLSSSTSNPLIPDEGLVRISTFETMPIMHNPVYQTNVFPNDNMNKSISQISQQQSLSSPSSSSSSSSSSTSSQASYQKRFNGILRNDPLLNAAMEDFRQLRRTSSRSTSFTTHKCDISRDSLCSNSSDHSSSRCQTRSRSPSRSHSQSSFTSLERLEIRHLIKALKAKGLQTMNNISLQILSPPKAPSPSIPKQSTSSLSINKQKKSSITEELDQEFRKIRLSNPNEEINYIKPSLLQKRKQSHQSIEIKNENKSPENPPVEYAIPIKKITDSPKKDENMRSFSFCKPINDLVTETQSTRPISMFNCLQYGLTNPFPTTFQPRQSSTILDKSMVKENIYASDIEVHLPLSNDKDHFNYSNLMKDYLADYKEQSTKHSSKFHDFSRLFTRSTNKKTFKHEQKTKTHHSRCSIM